MIETRTIARLLSSEDRLRMDAGALVKETQGQRRLETLLGATWLRPTTDEKAWYE
jgi:hypothetical protein